LKNDYENGKPVAVIAAKLGRSTNTIEARAGKMRLQRNQPLLNTREVKAPTTFQASSPSRELLKKIDGVIFQLIDTPRWMKKKS
jgi:hypothetical protein